MSKIRLVAICLLIVCIFSACAKSVENVNSKETKKSPVTKEDYLDALYGYYDYDGYYYYIAEDHFEKKDKTTGILMISDMINSIDVQLADDGVLFDIIFYRNSRNPILMQCSSDGVVADDTGNVYTVITKEEYESVAPVVSEYSESDFDSFISSQVEEVVYPWYVENFDTYNLAADLQYIDNLFAVGKTAEAKKAIQERIFGKLDKKVDEFIKSREYWAAYNYVAMYNVIVTGKDEYKSYTFIDDYFEKEHTSADSINIGGDPRFSDFTQKYYIQILKAKNADTNIISKQDCLYKMNEYLLQSGLGTKRGVWDGKYKTMYFTDFLDQNNDVTDYFVICPYTGMIRHVPATYYFLDRGNLYENALKQYIN